jgi:hypothetical protein
MGDSGWINKDRDGTEIESDSRLYCQRVRFVDYDYAPDGTYWGGGIGTDPLYCVFDREDTTRRYYRAKCRADALAQFREEWPEHFSRVVNPAT